MAGRVVVVVALAASMVLMAGCSAEPALPPALTPAELKAIIAQQQADWWESIAPGEPQPVVEPIEYITPSSEGTQVTDCILAAQLEGVRESQGGINFSGTDPAVNDAFNRQQFICFMQYPYEISDPEAMGYFSDEQLEYLYDYNTRRVLPCLQLLGYAVLEAPPDYANGNGFFWSPYYSLRPQPTSASEWRRIDMRCPPPPIGVLYRPGEENG